MMLRGALAALLSFCAGAVVAAEPALQIEALASPVKVRLRGLSAFNDDIAWASGREGTVLRTRDGGKHWDVFKVPGASDLDFRDVQAFGANEALVMGAGPGDASRVYRTADGGRTWTLVLRNPDADGFFDCMDFDGQEGRLLGDPVKGRFQVFASSDRGRSWRATKGPEAKEGEAAFAASGTCLRRVRAGTVIVSGGAVSRALFLPDRLERKGDWHALEFGNPQPLASSGLFSVADAGARLVAVGGDYKREAEPGLVAGFTAAGDMHYSHPPPHPDPVVVEPWSNFAGAPSGYRSGIACARGTEPKCVATGPAGTDVLGSPLSPEVRAARQHSRDEACPPGQPCNTIDVQMVDEIDTWRRASDLGYDAVSIAGNVVWFSGDEGRLGRMGLPPQR